MNDFPKRLRIVSSTADTSSIEVFDADTGVKLDCIERVYLHPLRPIGPILADVVFTTRPRSCTHGVHRRIESDVPVELDLVARASWRGPRS